jgi:VWFA-related protein
MKTNLSVLWAVASLILGSAVGVYGVSTPYSGVIVEIQSEFPETGAAASNRTPAEEFHLKIDLLKITPQETIPLKSNTVTARDGVPVAYKFGFQPSGAAEIVSFTVDILPTFQDPEGREIRFEISLYRGLEKLKEETVVTRGRESVIVELLEHRQHQATIAFKIQPSAGAFDSPPSLKYDVSVNMMVVPIFAVDSKGRPIFDLKEEDLALKVDGRPAKIVQFGKIEFDPQKGAAAAERGAPVMRNERVIFIIIDSMFNEMTGYRRSKKIAAELVRQGLPGDHFVILVNHEWSGLRWVAGPDIDQADLIKKIENLKSPIALTARGRYSSFRQPGQIDFESTFEPMNESQMWAATQQARSEFERLRYQTLLNRFQYVLTQFRYALRTINRPKIVFLISQGPARGAFGKGKYSEMAELSTFFKNIFIHDDLSLEDQRKLYSAFLFYYLRSIVRAVNHGGSVLYTINPRRQDVVNDEQVSGELGLHFLAHESGGRYFAGSDPGVIAKQIQKTTAAYYELAFTPPKDTGEKMDIDIACQRKGVRIHTLNYAEKERPYARMEEVQKKLFAFNVATGGDWSRMVGKVVKVKHERIAAEKRGEKRFFTLKIELPQEMQERRLDIFAIRFEPKSQQVHCEFYRKVVGSTEQMHIDCRRGEDLYFVMVEPEKTYCIYSEVK